VQHFQENKFLLRHDKGAIVLNLQPMGIFNKLPRKFTFSQAMFITLQLQNESFQPPQSMKLSVFKSMFVLILTYGHESCVMTERVSIKHKWQKSAFCNECTV